MSLKRFADALEKRHAEIMRLMLFEATPKGDLPLKRESDQIRRALRKLEQKGIEP